MMENAAIFPSKSIFSSKGNGAANLYRLQDEMRAQVEYFKNVRKASEDPKNQKAHLNTILK
jgi:hypothetical protein